MNRKYKVSSIEEVKEIQSICKVKITELRQSEKEIKSHLKELEMEAKNSRSQLNKMIKIRKFYQHELKLVPIRFRSKQYQHRIWASENPGLAFERMIN